MISSIASIALAASIIPNALAQTPDVFKPGTLVKLGVSFPSINIDPVGSALQSLDQVQTAPVITVPASNLVGASGKIDPNQRFMVFMIDIDVIQNNVATTVLHWFQPNLALESTQAAGAIMAPALPGANTSSIFAQSLANTMMQLVKGPPRQASITGITLPATTIGQADYLPPGPPPGPPHRYVQVLFAQPSNFSVPQCFQNVLSTPGNASANGQRLGFDINQFLAASNVRTRPIAGNYFRASNAKPGSLVANAVATQLVNARCPGITPVGATRMKRWFA